MDPVFRRIAEIRGTFADQRSDAQIVDGIGGYVRFDDIIGQADGVGRAVIFEIVAQDQQAFLFVQPQAVLAERKDRNLAAVGLQSGVLRSMIGFLRQTVEILGQTSGIQRSAGNFLDVCFFAGIE